MVRGAMTAGKMYGPALLTYDCMSVKQMWWKIYLEIEENLELVELWLGIGIDILQLNV